MKFLNKLVLKKRVGSYYADHLPNDIRYRNRAGEEVSVPIENATVDELAFALGRWLEERCVIEANAKSLTAELFSDWKQWADSAGEFIGSQKRFSDLLLTRGIEKWRNTTGLRGFRGLGLKHPPAPSYTPYSDH